MKLLKFLFIVMLSVNNYNTNSSLNNDVSSDYRIEIKFDYLINQCEDVKLLIDLDSFSHRYMLRYVSGQTVSFVGYGFYSYIDDEINLASNLSSFKDNKMFNYFSESYSHLFNVFYGRNITLKRNGSKSDWFISNIDTALSKYDSAYCKLNTRLKNELLDDQILFTHPIEELENQFYNYPFDFGIVTVSESNRIKIFNGITWIMISNPSANMTYPKMRISKGEPVFKGNDSSKVFYFNACKLSSATLEEISILSHSSLN